MENENISDLREESGVTNQDSQSLDLEAVQATSEMNKSAMKDKHKGSGSILTEEIMGHDQRTGLVVEKEESPKMSGVLLGETEGLKSEEEEEAVKAKFLNEKLVGCDEIVGLRTGSVCGQENSTEDGNGVVADQQGLNLHLDSEITDSELRHSCSSEGDGKKIVGSDEIAKEEVVKPVFLNEKMVGSDEIVGSAKTENVKGVVTDQLDLNNLVPEIAEKEQIGSGSGSSLCCSEGVTDQYLKFVMRADDVTLGEADESNQEWRDFKDAIMRADQLDLESIGLKIERRVQASVEDVVKRYPQMNSMTMSLSIGDSEKILESSDVSGLEADRVAMLRESGEQRKMQALKAFSESQLSDMEGKLGVIKEAEVDNGKTIAQLEEETKTEVEKENNAIHELQELVIVEEAKETELKMEMPSKAQGCCIGLSC
ncbi:PREDICTED: LOC18790585 [Prunus dulcis]|uniref:PREDICTED: LOC18790585 n=1 Tax=Prunus dulcis TaxID=3755 RepID=A0A5E4EYZ3_PRUDU|nr:hypothetical protein L3X38_000679 [Prunus dulcis]VVA20974.1 PREDICTED: LOC18790585 [Prunus dulcis]